MPDELPARRVEVSMMKAIRYYRYGPPDVLKLEDTGLPAVGDQDVLIRVMAASVNPLDWHFMRGTPYILRAGAGLLRPKGSGLGADMAGRVEAVGKHVTSSPPATRCSAASPASELSPSTSASATTQWWHMPANQTFEQAASVPLAALTALQALRDRG